jgi:hypothetical protein
MVWRAGVHVALRAGPLREYGPAMPIRLGLLVLAASQLVLAVWMVAGPGSFYDHLGGFGPRNDHYLRDVATWEAALAATAAIAAWRPEWRLPVLVFAALQFVLHTASHIADAGAARASTDGVFDAVSLGAGAVLLGALAWLAARDVQESAAPS